MSENIHIGNNLDWDGLEDLFPHLVQHDKIPHFGDEEECYPFAWCRANFGLERFVSVGRNEYRINHQAIWDSWDGKYGFRNADDAVMFKLTWCGSHV